jgi:hypothetical protein
LYIFLKADKMLAGMFLWINEERGPEMKKMDAKKLRPFLMTCALAAFTTLAFSGCLGGCINIPAITIPVTIAENISLPSTLIALGAGYEFEDFTLGEDIFPEYCDLPSQEDIRQQVEAVAGDFVAGLVTLDSVIVKEVRFEASSGDFSTIDNITVALQVNDQEVNLGSGGPSATDNTKIVLSVPEPPNLIDLLFGESESNCVKPIVHLSGEVPAQNITFSVYLVLEVQVSVG